ncbi:phage tail fiber protein [Caldanaerobius polysaccharolyticus]|uniref:phage tail fiber protein n=1 Tax=Caldanaerobius polysaccharolyticus TaxID=44256 RepID=UPI00047A963F|nr:hypothetical protein [Caldanaerobius polysaccharolyticus]
MAAISTYLANKLLDHTLRNVAYTPPTTVYVALYTSNPGAGDTGTEVSGGGYARQQITFNVASGGQITNNADVVFPVATASWGTVTHIGIRDAAAGGNLLYYMPLDVTKTIDAGDQLKIPVGQLTISMV